MKRTLYRLLFGLGVLVSSVPRAQAAYDIFLQIPGISGESTDAKHVGWIDVYSISHGISNPGGGAGGASAGKPVHADFSISKKLDKASLPLDLAVNRGTTNSSAVVIEFQRSGATPVVFYRVTLYNAVVESTSTGGAAGNDSLTDNISIRYTRIQWQYWPLDTNGSPGTVVTSEWDLTTNTGK